MTIPVRFLKKITKFRGKGGFGARKKETRSKKGVKKVCNASFQRRLHLRGFFCAEGRKPIQRWLEGGEKGVMEREWESYHVIPQKNVPCGAYRGKKGGETGRKRRGEKKDGREIIRNPFGTWGIL